MLCAVLLCEPIRPLSVKQTDSCPQFPGFADNRTHATQCCDYLTFVSRGVLVSCVHLCLQLCSWWKRSDRQSMGSPGQTRSVLNAIRPIRTICTLPVRPSAACKYTQTHMFLPNTPNTYCIHHRAAFKNICSSLSKNSNFSNRMKLDLSQFSSLKISLHIFPAPHNA